VSPTEEFLTSQSDTNDVEDEEVVSIMEEIKSYNNVKKKNFAFI
jgi:hypothetical protein